MTITIQQAAALAGLPVTPKPLVLREPCLSCDDARTERDTGAGYCAASPYGDHECEALTELHSLAGLACELAAVIARYHKPEVRKSLAESIYDGLADVLYEMHGRPALDEREFMRLCGVTS